MGLQVKIVEEVLAELESATKAYPAFNSAHEGYAILLEEVEELWLEVMKKPGWRSKERMRAEAIQICAMSLRFIQDVCEEQNGSS